MNVKQILIAIANSKKEFPFSFLRPKNCFNCFEMIRVQDDLGKRREVAVESSTLMSIFFFT